MIRPYLFHTWNYRNCATPRKSTTRPANGTAQPAASVFERIYVVHVCAPAFLIECSTLHLRMCMPCRLTHFPLCARYQERTHWCVPFMSSFILLASLCSFPSLPCKISIRSGLTHDNRRRSIRRSLYICEGMAHSFSYDMSKYIRCSPGFVKLQVHIYIHLPSAILRERE